MAKEQLAIFPGTFDPITNGHVSLVKRGLELFGNVVVAVATETTKSPMFSLEERIELAKNVFFDKPNVTVEGFSGLLVDYAYNRGANIIMRGLRAVSDFEYEFQMALMNRRLNRRVQTIYLMTDYRWMYLSSTIIKEAARLNGNVRGLVPEVVRQRLYSRFGAEKK